MEEFKNNAKLLSSHVVFDSPFVRVKKDKIEKGSEVKDFYIIEGTELSALLITHEAKGILLVKQFRYTHNDYFWGLPGGRSEKDETLKRSAIRESIEETGYRPVNLQHFVDVYLDPGQSEKKVTVFLANTSGVPQADFDEEIDSRAWYQPEQVKQMLIDDRIKDPVAAVALGKWFLLQDRM